MKSLSLTVEVPTMIDTMKLAPGRSHRRFPARQVGWGVVMIYKQGSFLSNTMSKPVSEL